MNGRSSTRFANEARLLARIQQQVPIEHISTTIAGREYPWTRVVDCDKLFVKASSYDAERADEFDPFWAGAWRSAEGLDKFFGTLSCLKGIRILELGGGTGRAGIAAAMRGADVLITDVIPTALMVCKFNARHLPKNVQVRLLDWRDSSTQLQSHPIIIGSDIVYDVSIFPALEPCMRRHLAPGGVVYLSEPQRHTGDRFEKWITAAGWRCNTSLIDLGDSQRQIRIFSCRL